MVVKNLERILTFDVGQSSVKAAVHEGGEVELLKSFPTDYSSLQHEITEVVREQGITSVGFATSAFRDDAGKKSWLPEGKGWKQVFDYEKLSRDAECGVEWIGNDAEATALAINDPHTKVTLWQEGEVLQGAPRGVLYLGTGFQFCPVDSTGRATYSVNFLMPVGDGTIGKPLEKGIKSLLKGNRSIDEVNLRMKDICSGQGIKNIYKALTGTEIKDQDIRDLDHQETYETFSRVLGGVLRQILASGSYRGGLFVGGTLAAALDPHLRGDLILEGFQAKDSGFIDRVKAAVPLGLMNDLAATHRGIAYAMRNEISSTYVGIVEEPIRS